MYVSRGSLQGVIRRSFDDVLSSASARHRMQSLRPTCADQVHLLADALKMVFPLELLITFNRKEKSEDKYGTVITRRLRDAPALLPIVKESSLSSFYVIEPRSSKSSKICGLFFSLSRKALVEICSMG